MSAFWFELRYWLQEMRHRAWRGWCIFAFDHDPSEEVEWLWGVLRRQAARIRSYEEALDSLSDKAGEMESAVNAALYRAGDADEP